MKVKDIVNKLSELPQDEEVIDINQIQPNDDFTKGMLLGIALCYLSTGQSQNVNHELEINRLRNIAGEFESIPRSGFIDCFKK